MAAALPAPPDAIDFGTVRRALVIKLRHHGDVLLASPVLSALKAHAPHVEVDALVYADTVDMLSGHPALARLFTIDRGWKQLGILARLRAESALRATLAERAHDLVIHLTDHRRGQRLVKALKPRHAVAPQRRGDNGWAATFSHLYALPREGNRRHTVETHLDALRRIGLFPGETERRLVLVPGAAAEARIDDLLREHGLAAREFVHLHPASRWMFKTWPAERTAQLMDQLAADGHALVLTCAPSDTERALVAAIRARTGAPALDLSGQLSLKELAALTARARLFVGVDSAPMHIAAAMGTPTVALFGPSGEIEWGPWQVAHRIVVSTEHPCRPCGQDGCGGSKVSECLTTLPVARVKQAADALLAANGSA